MRGHRGAQGAGSYRETGAPRSLAERQVRHTRRVGKAGLQLGDRNQRSFRLPWEHRREVGGGSYTERDLPRTELQGSQGPTWEYQESS